jgi:hypothetical protein
MWVWTSAKPCLSPPISCSFRDNALPPCHGWCIEHHPAKMRLSRKSAPATPPAEHLGVGARRAERKRRTDGVAGSITHFSTTMHQVATASQYTITFLSQPGTVPPGIALQTGFPRVPPKTDVISPPYFSAIQWSGDWRPQPRCHRYLSPVVDLGVAGGATLHSEAGVGSRKRKTCGVTFQITGA